MTQGLKEYRSLYALACLAFLLVWSDRSFLYQVHNDTQNVDRQRTVIYNCLRTHPLSLVIEHIPSLKRFETQFCGKNKMSWREVIGEQQENRSCVCKIVMGTVNNHRQPRCMVVCPSLHSKQCLPYSSFDAFSLVSLDV